MSHVLIDDGGKFVAGRLLSSQDTSAQIELPSGKRVKTKAQAILLRFDAPDPQDLLEQAHARTATIDLGLAWEFSGDDEFGFADLAADYFGTSAGPVDQVAMLLAMHGAPHYFRRAGKGRFRRAPPEQLQAALLGIERKKQAQAQIDEWVEALQQGVCPAAIAAELYRILFKPDKNGPHYKAVVQAARSLSKGPLEMLRAAGAIASPYQFHWQRFLFEHFPKGTSFAPVPADWVSSARDRIAALPMADEAVVAFSVDDSSTTEIDDALSVRGLGTGEVVLGIHIAVPGLAIDWGDAIEQQARERMSTVYMPCHKITMLPDTVVREFSLDEGAWCPALSLYLSLDEASLAIQGSLTRLERVRIASNLRHDVLDARASAQALASDVSAKDAGLPFAAELSFLFRLAQQLKAQREVVRGRPETFNRPDYSFRLIRPESMPAGSSEEPTGDEQVAINVRRRGAPLDLIVSECMILANSTWGAWLAASGVPAIYRTQSSLQPGIKVRMGTRPQRHAGIGVDTYAWCTSPLRRFCDLVNQWQLLACVQHGHAAALMAPFKPKGAELLAVIGAFDATYAAYAEFQASVERYWTLRALQLGHITELTAVVAGAGRVRAEEWPLMFVLAGVETWPRGTRLRARVLSVDLLSLELHGQLAERLDARDTMDSSRDAQDEDLLAEPDDEMPEAVGLRLAVDLDEHAASAVDPAGTSPGEAQAQSG